MNFWKQTTHVMSYFNEENFRGDKRLPSNFITGFLEVRSCFAPFSRLRLHVADRSSGPQLIHHGAASSCLYIEINKRKVFQKTSLSALEIRRLNGKSRVIANNLLS
jgi:hypothetical protein